MSSSSPWENFLLTVSLRQNEKQAFFFVVKENRVEKSNQLQAVELFLKKW